MTVWTDFPEHLKPGYKIFVGEDHQPVHIHSLRWHRQDILVSFNEYPSREDVGSLRNQVVMVRSADLPPLGEGELYLHQLLGLTVIDDANGRSLGTIKEILETGANDVYVVQDENGMELLLPAIEPVILEIDLAVKQIRVHLLPGLLPEDQ